MADAGEGIVFGEDGDDRRAAAGGGAERCGHVADWAFDIESADGEKLRQPSRRFFFAVGDFGIGVDAQAEVGQRIAVSVDGGAGALFEGREIHEGRLA